ncbi:MAG: hypothetical protein ACKO9Q_28215 [Pirellula sp.]
MLRAKDSRSLTKSHTNAKAIVLGGLLACGTISGAMADNWPQWRGPKNDGVSTEKNIATQWSPQENVMWRCELPGQAGATPVVWQDRIFLTSAQGDDLVLMAVSTKDGNR